jgi:hypothetical protein
MPKKDKTKKDKTKKNKIDKTVNESINESINEPANESINEPIDKKIDVDLSDGSEGIDEQVDINEDDNELIEKKKAFLAKKKMDRLKERYEYKPQIERNIIIVHPDNRITSDVATHFEIAEIIGQRAKQIEQGSPCFTDVNDISDPIDCAKRELLAKRCPLNIMRQISEYTYEMWEVNDMIIDII